MPPVQRADSRARKIAAVLVLVAAVFGVALLVAYVRYEQILIRWIESHLDLFTTYPVIPALAALLLVVPICFAGGYLWLYGKRAVRSSRMPPPGYAVARATRVYEGQQANKRGYVVMVLAMLLILAALMLPVFVGLIFSTMAG